MRHTTLHRAVRLSATELVHSLVQEKPESVDEYDRRGQTPLGIAVALDPPNVKIVELLLTAGAEPMNLVQESDRSNRRTVFEVAISAGDPEVVRRLIQYGASVKDVDTRDYGALLIASYSAHPKKRPEIFRILADAGARLTLRSSYGETPANVLSLHGDFATLKVYHELGGPIEELQWNPLHYVAAFNDSISEIEVLRLSALVESRDHRGRTPLHLAATRNSANIVSILHGLGAKIDTVDDFQESPLRHAASLGSLATVRWLIEQGADPNRLDGFGHGACICAATSGHVDVVTFLLSVGADANRPGTYDSSVLQGVTNRDIILKFLEAGLSPSNLASEERRVLLGHEKLCDEVFTEISSVEFARAETARFGSSNPHQFHEPYWEAMIKTRASGYWGTTKCADTSAFERGTSPAWSAKRFGQSLTVLPDGRIIEIAGEHEDSYDPDFWIYNDVFVHGKEGSIDIYGYPAEDFPPTDFHSATLVGDYIYIVGSLGYQETRASGSTPVYRLNIHTLLIEPVNSNGDEPFRLYDHLASLIGTDVIEISSGKCLDQNDALAQNSDVFHFNVATSSWTKSPPIL